ncbi:MAG TPA: ROK family transcriptional regulator [Streptosporangiales bacterium]
MVEPLPLGGDEDEQAGVATTPWSRPAWQGTTLRRRNFASIMRTVLAHGPISRTEIADAVGLTATTLTNVMSILIDAGLVKEDVGARTSGDRGRPKIPVVIDPAGLTVVGVHIGGRMTTVGLVDLSGVVGDEITIPHRGEDPHAVIRSASAAVTKLVGGRDHGGPVLGVGASIGGWVDTSAGTVVDHPSLPWHGVELRSELERRLDMPVLLDSNARAMALAESWFGAARGVGNLLYLSVGTIVSAAIVINGAIHRGPRAAAGHVNHLPVGARASQACTCGRRDCLQVAVSDRAVIQAARKAGIAGRTETIERLTARAEGGDARADRLLRTRARHLGYAIGLLTDVLNPDRVVLSGGILLAPHYLRDVLHATETRANTAADVAGLVVPSTLGEHSLALASGALLLDAYYRDPVAYPPLAQRAKGPRPS